MLVQRMIIGAAVKSGPTVKNLLLKEMKHPINAFVGSC